MITRAEWIRRQWQWSEYHRWAAGENPQHPPEQVIGDVGAILEWIPQSVRAEDRDPERRGVRRMHVLLGLLKDA